MLLFWGGARSGVRGASNLTPKEQVEVIKLILAVEQPRGVITRCGKWLASQPGLLIEKDSQGLFFMAYLLQCQKSACFWALLDLGLREHEKLLAAEGQDPGSPWLAIAFLADNQAAFDWLLSHYGSHPEGIRRARAFKPYASLFPLPVGQEGTSPSQGEGKSTLLKSLLPILFVVFLGIASAPGLVCLEGQECKEEKASCLPGGAGQVEILMEEGDQQQEEEALCVVPHGESQQEKPSLATLQAEELSRPIASEQIKEPHLIPS